MLTDAVKKVAAKIGQFYLIKNNGDYEATAKEIDSLRISKIEVEEDKVVIVSPRVGLLIGKRATNIERLAKFLEVEVKLLEDMDNLYDYLVPRPYNEWEY